MNQSLPKYFFRRNRNYHDKNTIWQPICYLKFSKNKTDRNIHISYFHRQIASLPWKETNINIEKHIQPKEISYKKYNGNKISCGRVNFSVSTRIILESYCEEFVMTFRRIDNIIRDIVKYKSLLHKTSPQINDSNDDSNSMNSDLLRNAS